jgi:Cu/Ag efflux protein CusF
MLVALFAVLLQVFSAGAFAQAATGEVPMTEGVVKKVDKSAGKVTISHEALTNLGMPKMTMVFRVQDPSWCDQMKEGDKIRFVADKVGGAFTVVKFEPARNY